MIDYIRYKCRICGRTFDLRSNDGSTSCPKCGERLEVVSSYQGSEQLDIVIKYLKSIKNMLKFFVILTIIGMIFMFIYIIMLVARGY